MPGIVFNFSFAIGTIRFGDREICGYFIGMPGVGLPRGRFDFHGRKPFGTADVPPFWSIQDFVEEWNHYNIWYKSHVPRSGIAKADKPRDDEDCKYLTLFAKLDAKDRSWRKDFLLSITGYFCITDVSIGIKGQRHVRERTIRVHVGDDDTRIWGHFDFGEVEGYICTSPILKEDGNVLEDAIEFKWHGRESETGKSLRRSLSGKGTVAFLTNMTILGTFCKMVGDHDIHFNGKRKFMPEGSSGLNMAYYRKGWDDYSHGNSVDVSYS
jgi:hypothetical protein